MQTSARGLTKKFYMATSTASNRSHIKVQPKATCGGRQLGWRGHTRRKVSIAVPGSGRLQSFHYICWQDWIMARTKEFEYRPQRYRWNWSYSPWKSSLSSLLLWRNLYYRLRKLRNLRMLGWLKLLLREILNNRMTGIDGRIIRLLYLRLRLSRKAMGEDT